MLVAIDLKTYAAKNSDLLQQPGKYLGGWRDSETNRVYLDVSTIVKSDGEAKVLAIDFKQEAYYDLGTGTEVRVGAHKAYEGGVPAAEPDRRRNSALRRFPQWRDDPGNKALADLQSPELWAQLKAIMLSRMGPVFKAIQDARNSLGALTGAESQVSKALIACGVPVFHLYL